MRKVLSVRYCNKICQRGHWELHKKNCEDFTSGLDEGQNFSLQTCDSCGKTGESLLRCGKCRSVRYCNKICQRGHWELHKKSCGKIKEISEKKKDFTSGLDDGQSSSLKTCNSCGKTGFDLRRCASCKLAWYCETTCRKQDLISHQNNCKVGKHDERNRSDIASGQGDQDLVWLLVYLHQYFQSTSNGRQYQMANQVVRIPSIIDKPSPGICCITFGDDGIKTSRVTDFTEHKRSILDTKIELIVRLEMKILENDHSVVWIRNKSGSFITRIEEGDEGYDKVYNKLCTVGYRSVYPYKTSPGHSWIKYLYCRANLNSDFSLDVDLYSNSEFRNLSWQVKQFEFLTGLEIVFGRYGYVR